MEASADAGLGHFRLKNREFQNISCDFYGCWQANFPSTDKVLLQVGKVGYYLNNGWFLHA